MIVIWEGTCAFIVELSVALCSCFHYYPFFLSFSLSQLRFLFLLCLRFFFVQLVFRPCVLPWNPTTAPPCIFFVVEINLFTILSIIDCILLPPLLLSFFFYLLSPFLSHSLIHTILFFYSWRLGVYTVQLVLRDGASLIFFLARPRWVLLNVLRGQDRSGGSYALTFFFATRLFYVVNVGVVL